MRFIAALFLTAASLSVFAGEWHYRTKLVCSDCHTNHNSADGQPMRYDDVADPAAYMLRRETALALCLGCHDGGRPTAPDVIAPISYVSQTAGGAFANSGGTSTDRAHDLAMSTPVIPPGGTQEMILTCTTCHDPHGNDNYRNLRTDPAKTGATLSVVANQTVKANGTNPSQVYVPSNITYKSGVSRWCISCHGEPVEGSDHPADRTIWGAVQASYTAWTSVPSSHFRVPAHSPTDDAIPSQDDQVMCLSCHKAHGSDHHASEIWADELSLDSTCQECHNQ